MADEKKPTEQSEQQTPPPASEGQKKALKIILIVVGVFVLLAILGVALLGVFGAKIGKEIVEEATNTEISQDDGSYKVETEDGSLEFGSAEIPEDFPQSVAIYTPSTATTSSSMGTQDGNTWTVGFTTQDSVDQVYDFYKSELTVSGWEQQSTYQSGGAKTFSSTNEGEKLRAQVSVSPEDDQTSFVLTVIKYEQQ